MACWFRTVRTECWPQMVLSTFSVDVCRSTRLTCGGGSQNFPSPRPRGPVYLLCTANSMPKARESHFKNQTAFSFHMQKRDEKCKLQTTALRWETFTENKKQTNQITIFCKVLLSQYFYSLFLIKLLRKSKLISKEHLRG